MFFIICFLYFVLLPYLVLRQSTTLATKICIVYFESVTSPNQRSGINSSPNFFVDELFAFEFTLNLHVVPPYWIKFSKIYLLVT